MTHPERNWSKRSTHSLDPLKLAEYISLVLSLVGAIVAAATRQVFYGVAPLSISLCLNVLNRQRFEQYVRQTLHSLHLKTEEQLAQLDRSRLEWERKWGEANESTVQLKQPELDNTELPEPDSGEESDRFANLAARTASLDDFLDFFDVEPEEE